MLYEGNLTLRHYQSGAAVHLPDTDEYVGSICFHSPIGAYQEIGWGTNPQHRQKGYMSRAVRDVIAHLRATQPDMVICASAYPDNTASIATALRAGMTLLPPPDDWVCRWAGKHQVVYFEYQPRRTDMEFMTITEIASGLYRKNGTATEYAMALALYKKLDPAQKREVMVRGEALYCNITPVAA